MVPCGVLTLMASRSVSKSSKTVCEIVFLIAIAVPLCVVLFELLV